MLMTVDISSGQVSGVDSLSAAPSSIVNWEADDAGINRPRAGLSAYPVTNLSSSIPVGLAHWKSYMMCVTTDRSVWAVPDATPTYAQAGSDSTDTTTQVEGDSRITFAIGDSSIYMAGGGRLQRWSPSLVLSEVVADSPRCTHVAALNQYLVTNVADAGSPSTVQWSDIGEGVWDTWPAANIMNADSRPDPVVGVFENAGELYVFGSETLQVHSLGSDPTFPFELVTSSEIGLGAPYAFCKLDQSCAFLDNRRRIVIGDGRSNEPVSQAIQSNLRGLETINDCFMYREERGQFSFLVVRFPTEARTFVYDLNLKAWRERDYYAAPFHVDYPVTAHVYWPSQNIHLMGSSLSAGGLLKLDESSREDVAGPLVSELTTGWQEFGTAQRKQSSEIRLVMRRGPAAQGATPGILEIRRQCDDGPWSEWQHVSIGTPSQYQQVQRIFMRRIFRRCRYGIRYSSTDNTAIVSLHDDVTPLTDGAEAEART